MWFQRYPGEHINRHAKSQYFAIAPTGKAIKLPSVVHAVHKLIDIHIHYR